MTDDTKQIDEAVRSSRGLWHRTADELRDRFEPVAFEFISAAMLDVAVELEVQRRGLREMAGYCARLSRLLAEQAEANEQKRH